MPRWMPTSGSAPLSPTQCRCGSCPTPDTPQRRTRNRSRGARVIGFLDAALLQTTGSARCHCSPARTSVPGSSFRRWRAVSTVGQRDLQPHAVAARTHLALGFGATTGPAFKDWSRGTHNATSRDMRGARHATSRPMGPTTSAGLRDMPALVGSASPPGRTRRPPQCPARSQRNMAGRLCYLSLYQLSLSASRLARSSRRRASASALTASCCRARASERCA